MKTMSRSKESEGSGATLSLMETSPREAWAVLAKLESESPGGMTGLPILRSRLNAEERKSLRRYRTNGIINDETRERVRQLVTAGKSGREIAGELRISLPSVTAMRKRVESQIKKRVLVRSGT